MRTNGLDSNLQVRMQRFMTRYLVDTEASIQQVRDALIVGVTLKHGHVVFINAHESLPLGVNLPQEPRMRRISRRITVLMIDAALVGGLYSLVKWWLG
jgi:hypothetical protein